MNYSVAVFLINDAARAVEATYEAGEKAPKEIFKTFDKAIKVGDLVVVPSNTRHLVTTVKVTAVDIDFDLDTPKEIKWVIGKVDLADYEEIKKQETVAIEAIKSAELRKKRDELRKALFADHSAKLQELDIATGHKAIEETKTDTTASAA